MFFRFPQLRQLQPGGTLDNLAFAAVAAGGMLSHPLLAGMTSTGILGGFGMALAGGAWWGRRISQALRMETLEGSELRIRSSAPPPPTPDGMHIGYLVDSGRPLVVPMDDWSRHAMVCGMTGVGKTVFGSWMLFQQIERGGGLLWIDGKLDPDNFTLLYHLCAHAGRLDDLRIISPGTPEFSNSYNPILYGDPDEVAARILSVIPASEQNPGSDYYRQSANQGLLTLTQAIQATGYAYNAADLAVLLMNPEAINKLQRLVPAGSDAERALAHFLFQFQTPVRHGSDEMRIDIKKLKDVFGGIGGRLNTFGSGAFGQVSNTYSPEVRLTEDIVSNRVIYVALPTMGKQEAASNFGKLVVGDLRTAIAQVQDLPKHQRPNPPFLCFFDEAGSYITQAFSRPFEQARSARVVLVPAFQTKGNLEYISPELRGMIAGNTLTKLFFRPGEPDTAEWMAEMIGTERQTRYSISASKGSSKSRNKAPVSTSAGSDSGSGSIGYSESVEEDYRVSPSELFKLGKGECVVALGSKVYHVRIPLLSFTPEFRERVGEPTITHTRVRRRRGLDFWRDLKLARPDMEDEE